MVDKIGVRLGTAPNFAPWLLWLQYNFYTAFRTLCRSCLPIIVRFPRIPQFANRPVLA